MGKKFKKNCPGCNCVQSYARKDNLKAAIASNTMCKVCSNSSRALTPEAKKQSIRNSQLKYYYGIDIDTYNKMFKEQNGCCKICGRHQSVISKTMHVDHCHKTGAVRSLLCKSCNGGLGLFKDKEKLLLRAAAYIREHKDQNG